MRLLKIIIIVCILVSLFSSIVFARSFEVPADVKARAEKIELSFNHDYQVGDISIKYDLVQASAVRFWVKMGEGEWLPYFSEVYCLDDYDTCVYDPAPLSGNLATGGDPKGWTSNIIIHIEEINEDKDSLIVWIDENDDMIAECFTNITYLSNIDLYFGNYYAYDSMRASGLPNPFLAYDEIKEFETGFFRFEIDPSSSKFRLHLYGPVDTTKTSEQKEAMTIDFNKCGDTYFKFDGQQFLLQPTYYLVNGNYLIALKDVTKVCPAENLSDGMRLINLGIADEIRSPLDDIFVKEADKFGKSSIKMDIKVNDSEWKTYIFDDCSWQNINEDFSIRLAGIYGTSFEFYVKDKATEGAEEGNNLGLLDWLSEFFGIV